MEAAHLPDTDPSKLCSFPVPVDSASRLGESNGGDGSKSRVSGNNSTHFRSLSVDAASFESLGLHPLGNDGQSEKAGGGRGVQERGVHRHSNSMDGSTSSFEADTLSSDYSKKAMARNMVAELALIDPKRAKRIQRMETALSQSKINSPVAEQQVIENFLGKRVARRQGYRSRGPSSSFTSISMWSEMSTLRQQLADSLKAQEELR